MVPGGGARELIAAGLGDHTEGAAPSSTKLCAVVSPDGPELRDRLLIGGERHAPVAPGVDVVPAVDQPRIVRGANTVHGLPLASALVGRVRPGDSRHDHGQRHHVTPDTRERLHVLAVNHAAGRPGRPVDGDELGLDGDGFLQFVGFEHEDDLPTVVHTQRDARDNDFAEALELR